MNRTQVTDCRTLPFDVSDVFAALLDVENYPQWWPAKLRLRVLQVMPKHLGSRLEVRPRGGSFICEIGQIIPDREIVIRYVEGLHLGTGIWTLEKVAEGTRLCYRVDLEPHGWLPRLLSHVMDFAKMHSRMMRQLFDGLEGWLRVRN